MSLKVISKMKSVLYRLIKHLKFKCHLFSVSERLIRKNGITSQSLATTSEELGDKTPQLVFAGKYGWKIEAFSFLQEDLSLQRAVKIVPQATDADLATLYQRCLFFIRVLLKVGDYLLVKLHGLEI